MTYFRFHLYFNVTALAVLAACPLARAWGGGRVLAAAWVFLAVYIFTTPWDNLAVRRGIWNFTPGKFSRRLGYLPIEEYLFFGLQSLEVMLLVNLLVGAGWGGASWNQPRLNEPGVLAPLGGLALVWVAFGWAGRRRPRRSNYAWHLLFWFLPVLAAQWVIGWGILAPRWPLLVVPTILLGGWLTFADVLAVRAGLWFFDDTQITGHRLARVLPWEEVAFFHLTSLLVAQSYLLLLPEAVR